MSKSTVIAAAVIALIVGTALGYWYGNKVGYSQAESDIKALEEAAAAKSADEIAKAANPFQTENPLEGVEANPFQKLTDTLNPFRGR